MTLQVISAQQLPKINKDKNKSIVDPLVRVELYGVTADNASKETHYIENNGDGDSQHAAECPSHMSHRLSGIKTITSALIHCRLQPDVERELPV